MRMRPSAAIWVLFGGVAALSCSSGGMSGGTGGTGGSSGGTTGTAGNGAGGNVGIGGSAGGTTGSGGSAGGTGGSATGTGGGAGGSAGTAGGTGGTTGAGGGAAGAAGGTTGRGGSAGTGTGGGTGGGTAGGGGRGGTSAGGTSGSGGAAGRGGSSGGTGGSGTGGAGGGAAGNCSGRAISMSANGTSSDADTAQARVEVDLGSDLPTANTQRTVEFWAFIKTTDWVGEKNELYFYGGSAANTAFGMDFGTNPVTGMTNNHATLNPFTGGGSNNFSVDSTADLGITSSTDQWVHIAMVWNGTNLITYVNGLPKITATGNGATTLATGTSVLTIGGNPSNMGYFSGLYDEFRVWKVARTATEIMSNYNRQVAPTTANLVGYWKFDETSGTTTADAVTTAGHTAHNGTLKADTAAHDPTFVVPPTPLPLLCN